jgi:hypothetical protein
MSDSFDKKSSPSRTSPGLVKTRKKVKRKKKEAAPSDDNDRGLTILIFFMHVAVFCVAF